MAQAYLRDDPSDPNDLDPENNGVACEFTPVPYANRAFDDAPVAAARSEADLDCKDFEYQQEAQMVYFRDPSDPNGLDGPNEEAEKDERFVGNGVECETAPVLASNVFDEIGSEVKGGGTGGAEAASPEALVAAWPRSVGFGLAVDLIALLLVVCGVLALLTAWRGTRRTSGGPGR